MEELQFFHHNFNYYVAEMCWFYWITDQIQCFFSESSFPLFSMMERLSYGGGVASGPHIKGSSSASAAMWMMPVFAAVAVWWRWMPAWMSPRCTHDGTLKWSTCPFSWEDMEQNDDGVWIHLIASKLDQIQGPFLRFCTYIIHKVKIEPNARAVLFWKRKYEIDFINL